MRRLFVAGIAVAFLGAFPGAANADQKFYDCQRGGIVISGTWHELHKAGFDPKNDPTCVQSPKKP